MILSPEIRQAIEQSGGDPIELTDPQTGATYVLIHKEAYQLMQRLLDMDIEPLTTDEHRTDLAHAGRRAGWDDPAMDAYDELDPRTRA